MKVLMKVLSGVRLYNVIYPYYFPADSLEIHTEGSLRTFRGIMLGSVVIGIGIAGCVRMRDLLAPLPSSAAEKFSIKGFVSRRSLEDQQGVKQISMTEPLSRDDIHVAFICTENTSHEEQIRQFLEAGKHVCVEYPVTLSYESAVDLWNLAQEKERGPGLGRAKHIHFRFQDATITKLPAGQREPVSLFMQDLVLFGRKLQGEVSAAELQEERSRILHCLQLAERIQQLSESTQA
ncbi:biliverdin reductase A-like [Sinocyclocheilus rhinocerous]|uniref:biliverdin reductase A-like n=1 Tax=Sinocyclocheilus rhinocerous TaxID=307959 RepID=UPI0007B8435F|nr:PREDICTED: biliverdin reductase A-like [Sinocyclocheilus rhinocerous]